MPLAPRKRRTSNYWESIFDSALTHDFIYGDWSFQNNLGPHYQCFAADQLEKALTSRTANLKIKNVNFLECDFFGHFENIKSSIVFEKCTFRKCDFGLSTWERAKFSDCLFTETSFTQSTLITCEFRDCGWQKISMSGNETRLLGTYISNPKEFINSAFVNLDKAMLADRRASQHAQKLKSEETKSTVARNLYNNLKNIGDEDAFYEACEVSALQGLRYRVRRAADSVMHPINVKRFFGGALSFLPCLLELILTYFFGFCNKWGASVGRPLGLLVLSILVFSLVYHQFSDIGWGQAFSKSLDIGLIAGYTRVATDHQLDATRYVEWVDLIISLVFYSTFLATIVAKISRVR